jgi:hypothetical protein
MQEEAKRLNALTEQIIAAAIAVHRTLGPGLLESAYEAQMLSYLKIYKKGVGLVLNFNVKILTHGGIMRKVNGFPE